MAYTAWSVSQNEVPNATKWNYLGGNDALFYSFLGDDLEWQSWTPTLQGMVIGNGTITAAYTVQGNTVHGRFRVDYGTTSSFPNGVPMYFTLPVAWHNDYNLYVYSLGEGYLEDNAITGHPIFAWSDPATPNKVLLRILETVSFNQVANTNMVNNTTPGSGVPITWGATDYLDVHFSYEKA